MPVAGRTGQTGHTGLTGQAGRAGVLPWRTHLRICRSTVLSHRMYLVYALVFQVLIIVMGSEGAWYRISAVVLLGLLPSGLMMTVALTGEQLRAFGFATADQRRHRITVILVTAVFCVVAFGVNAAANVLSGGLPWWCLGAGAVLALVLLVVRAIPTGASGDTPATPEKSPERCPGSPVRRPPAAGSGGRQLVVVAVRRRWRPVLWALVALVVGQIVVRIGLPSAVDTVMPVLMIVVGMAAIITGQELSRILTTELVFSGSRKGWRQVVLRESAVVPVAGVVGAGAAVGLDRVFVGRLGWVDANPLSAIDEPSDAVPVLVAGAATGVIVVLVSIVAALVDKALPGWASIIAVMVGAASVVGLLYLVWSPGASGWGAGWSSLSGGVPVLVVGSLAVVPLAAWLVSRCSLRTDRDTTEWSGFGTPRGAAE